MRKFAFNKLIRSKLPALMQEAGVVINSPNLSSSEYIDALKNKLLEESLEVLEAKSTAETTEELADVLEVIASIANALDITMNQIDSARSAKKQDKGSFNADNYVSYIEVAQDNYEVLEFLKKKRIAEIV
jgi:predicted house-cleaning noncanonical NTP pyrophosphatase (MazG superfamily)